jgi:hypothetical protein
MDTNHTGGKAVRPAAVAGFAATAQRPQKMLNVLAMALGAILLALSAACTTEGQASPEEFVAATTFRALAARPRWSMRAPARTSTRRCWISRLSATASPRCAFRSRRAGAAPTSSTTWTWASGSAW